MRAPTHLSVDAVTVVSWEPSQFARWSLMVRTTHLVLLVATLAGCSLITAPDASLLTTSSAGGEGGSGGEGAIGGEGGTTTVGGGGSGATGGTGGVGGTGGAGGGCAVPEDCPTPTNECERPTCEMSMCGTAPRPDNTPVATQVDGDCKSVVCDGNSATKTIDDNGDLPDDSNPCTTDTCNMGVPDHDPVAAGTTCGQSLVCDNMGQCVGCLTASQCPGMDDECQTRTCTAGVCGLDFENAGTVVTMQTAGDCKQRQCNGNGAIVAVNLNSDVPVDGNQCTGDICTNGTPSNPNVSQGAACNQNNGTQCNGMGACVQCITAANCGTATDCRSFACNGGMCQTNDVMQGTPVPNQTAGDCKVVQCNGIGGTETVNANSDVPVDGNQCTGDVCMNGMPSNPNLNAGTACSQMGGTQCNGMGSCVQCVVAADCGVATECRSFTCATGMCQQNNTNVGTPTSVQTGGDCRRNECDGSGNIVNAIFDSDVPVDGNQCTADVCTTGTPSNPSEPINTPCSQNGGQRCDGITTCVECNTGNQCASLVCLNNACQTATCSDLVKNGSESDVDCGGPTCGTCANGKTCNVNGDCASGNCSGGICAPPVVPPTVDSTSPANSATNVSPLTSISITFSQAMDPASLDTKTTLDLNACTGSIQVSTDDFVSCVPLAAPTLSMGDTVATVVPTPALSFGSNYKIRVTTDATSAASVPLAANFTTANGFITATDTTVSQNGKVVISQYYGGGGNSGAPYTNDFIELKNLGDSPVNLNGWAVQYTSTSGSSWTSSTSLSGTIQAGGYFLIQEAAGATVSGALPTPDVTGTIAMGGPGGKVALTNTTTALTGACPVGGAIVDFVGVGSANCSETMPTGATSNTTAAIRNGSGCTDTNVNSADFTVAAPNPRNSSSAKVICSTVSANETGASNELDYCNIQSPTSISVQTGTALPSVFSRVFEAGVTETGGASSSVVAQFGYGPVTTNPETQRSAWTFVTAPYNIQVGNDDEYMAPATTAPAAGSYSYTFRYSVDGGATYTYCDINGAGSNAGLSFETPQLAPLTVTP
jgi:hypothetical protein